eukprot:CAMPEP_0184679776 /NCGR_PEP_ID=MMETSP0312-20130426/2643_1 /TAXON_ID=31354 /ORGANISM="Compsopogon coeruleus, Strain SAG 36.94" /LENGTH=323 /DNA_ID=CAMNT_0027129455 /DNA_START=210 /DNA_END=1181 /DNA_ORIENTATION=-
MGNGASIDHDPMRDSGGPGRGRWKQRRGLSNGRDVVDASTLVRKLSLESDDARDGEGRMTDEEFEVIERLRLESEEHASSRHRVRLGAVVVPYRGLVILPLAFWKFKWCGFEDRLEEIRLLDLRGNGLRLLSRKVGRLTNLRALLLGENELEFVPEEIGKLSQLRWLDLSNNRLRRISNDTLVGLSLLEDLNLSGNMLMSHTFPSSISSCKALKRVNLARNDLTDIPAGLNKLPELRELDLRENEVSYIPRVMYNLKKLQKLYILGGADVAHLGGRDPKLENPNVAIRTSSFVKLPMNLNVLVKGYSFHEKVAGGMSFVASNA